MQRIILTLIVAATGFSAGCACGGNDGNGKASATLGTGTTSFESLVAEQELELLEGTQGGHHFIAHARMTGIEPGDPAMPGLLSNPGTQFYVFTEGGDRIDLRFPPYRIGYRPADDGSLELPSGRILAVDEDRVSEIMNQRVRIRVEIFEEDGAMAADELFVVVKEVPLPADAGVR